MSLIIESKNRPILGVPLGRRIARLNGPVGRSAYDAAAGTHPFAAAAATATSAAAAMASRRGTLAAIEYAGGDFGDERRRISIDKPPLSAATLQQTIERRRSGGTPTSLPSTTRSAKRRSRQPSARSVDSVQLPPLPSPSHASTTAKQ